MIVQWNNVTMAEKNIIKNNMWILLHDLMNSEEIIT